MKPPAFQFYVRDWLTDTELSRCSPATRGIWIDMLAAMWVAPTRGQLDGMSFGELARLTRCTAEEAEIAVEELERTRTASVTRNGKVTGCHKIVTVECRRMRRDDIERKANADRQKRHREKTSQNNNIQSNATVTAPSASASSSAVSAIAKKHTSLSANADAVPHAEIVKAWNEAVAETRMKQIRRLTQNRRVHLRARWQEPDFRDQYAKIFEIVAESPFLSGNGSGGWKADFGWIIKNDENYIKVLEGKYDADAPQPTLIPLPSDQDRARQAQAIQDQHRAARSAQ